MKGYECHAKEFGVRGGSEEGLPLLKVSFLGVRCYVLLIYKLDHSRQEPYEVLIFFPFYKCEN